MRYLLPLLLLACATSEVEAPVGEEAGVADSGATGDDDGLQLGATNGTCVAEGERFADTWSCVGVTGSAPSQDAPAAAQVAHDPDTLADPDYAWVQGQLEACSCVCCHFGDGVEGETEGDADGLGAYVWSWDFGPAWTDASASSTLERLGAAGALHEDERIDPEGNHGFSSELTRVPTTDGERMEAFLQRELARREGR